MSTTDRADRGVEVAPGVFRLGSRRVSWYALHDDDAIVLIDAGLPGHLSQLHRHLDYTGRHYDSIRAVALTHAHSDHIGLVVPLSRLTSASVYIGEGDESLATGARRARTERPMRRELLHPALLRFYRELLLAGIRNVQPVTEVVALHEGSKLPSSIRPIPMPGHTAGSTAYVVPSRDVLFTGDALVTLDCVTGAIGPRLMPAVFSESTGRARDALTGLEHLPASYAVLPGHGDPWTDGLADAISRAR